ncbi:MAG: hypothetical protein HWN67_02975 [Candidatus Helarchaeota archaeon]|nr:hypothetical protein [Candidatus Helarchaeota archaeon]
MLLQVRVDNIDVRSALRGWVRLDPDIMKNLDLTTGDTIKITGKKTTAAIVIPDKIDYVGSNKIRMDNIVRKNCGVLMGGIVKIEKFEPKHAKKLTLVPLNEKIEGSGERIRRNLIARPVIKGDIIYYKFTISKSMRQNLFKYSRCDRSMPPIGGISFLVHETDPEDEIVQVVDKTKITILSEPINQLPETIQDYADILKKKLKEILKKKFLKEISFERIAYKLNIDIKLGINENEVQDLVEDLLKTGEIKGEMMIDRLVLVHDP